MCARILNIELQKSVTNKILRSSMPPNSKSILKAALIHWLRNAQIFMIHMVSFFRNSWKKLVEKFVYNCPNLSKIVEIWFSRSGWKKLHSSSYLWMLVWSGRAGFCSHQFWPGQNPDASHFLCCHSWWNFDIFLHLHVWLFKICFCWWRWTYEITLLWQSCHRNR